MILCHIIKGLTIFINPAERVLQTVLKPRHRPLLLATDHKATEAALQASGLTTTILRNGWHIENSTGSLAARIALGALIGAAGEGWISAAARKGFAGALAVLATAQVTPAKSVTWPAMQDLPWPRWPRPCPI